jgi:hypothetical protein
MGLLSPPTPHREETGGWATLRRFWNAFRQVCEGYMLPSPGC